MSSPFVKQLVASDRKTRDAALASLTKFLSSSRQFEEIELLKLWKALFYCFWHSDRTLVQQALAKDLANLCITIKGKNFIPFLKAFWITMCREWNSIDILRLDKFYSLLRCFIHASFARLVKLHWSEETLEEYIQLLERLPLSAKDPKVPNGIRYHLADIYLEELNKLVKDDDKLTVPINTLMRPFEAIIISSPTKSVRLRVMKAVFDNPLLAEYHYDMAAADEESAGSSQDADAVSDASHDASDSEEDGEIDGEDEEFTGFD